RWFNPQCAETSAGRWMPEILRIPRLPTYTPVNSIPADRRIGGVNMPELRQNFYTKEWVIIAKERAKPPEELTTHPPSKAVTPFVESGVFCPGNEAKTPPEVQRLPSDSPPTWQVRIVPNKFGALSRDAKPTRTIRRSHRTME